MEVFIRISLGFSLRNLKIYTINFLLHYFHLKILFDDGSKKYKAHFAIFEKKLGCFKNKLKIGCQTRLAYFNNC